MAYLPQVAPMSTTRSLATALAYSSPSKSPTLSPTARAPISLLIRLRTCSFMERGASLEWLSAFPAEQEVLFPPLVRRREGPTRDALCPPPSPLRRPPPSACSPSLMPLRSHR